MSRWTPKVALMFFALLLYGQLNAVVHLVSIPHDLCREHGVAAHPVEEGDESTSTHTGHNKDQHKDGHHCQVLFWLTCAFNGFTPEVPTVVETVSLLKANVIEIVDFIDNGRHLFSLSPCNSPPQFS